MFGIGYSKCKTCKEIEPEYRSETHMRVIVLYDKDGLPFKEFNTAKKLAEYLGMKSTSVNTQMCKGMRLKREYTAEWVVIERDYEDVKKKRSEYYIKKLKKCVN